MIDVRLMRSDPQVFIDSFRRRGVDIDVERLLEIDERHRNLLAAVESGRAEHNAANKKISSAPPDQRQAVIDDARSIGERFKDLEIQLKEAADGWRSSFEALPNLTHPETPGGSGDENNRVLREVGGRREFDFAAKDHLSIGEDLDIIDTARAAKVSGSRFGFLKGDAALLELGLVRFAFDRLGKHGFRPVIPPVLVREEALYGTGFFPTDEAQIYKTAVDDLFLVGTSEVPLASMHAGEVLPLEELPLSYGAYSPCFRREAGTYGKDTRGIIRLHQFEKVEMFVFCSPEASEEQHERILSIEEEIFQALEIPYRVVEVCAGELGAPAFRKFDLEAWLPGAERYVEITSCSNCTDYQSRRLNIRFKSDAGNELVHTLNGTAVAMQRTIVALLENHQQGDGSVRLPQALAEFTGLELIKL